MLQFGIDVLDLATDLEKRKHNQSQEAFDALQAKKIKNQEMTKEEFMQKLDSFAKLSHVNYDGAYMLTV